MTRKKKRRSLSSDRQNSALLGAIGTGFLGYFLAEFTLAGRPHPLHWLVMGTAGLVGYGGGTTRSLPNQPAVPDEPRPFRSPFGALLFHVPLGVLVELPLATG